MQPAQKPEFDSSQQPKADEGKSAPQVVVDNKDGKVVYPLTTPVGRAV